MCANIYPWSRFVVLFSSTGTDCNPKNSWETTHCHRPFVIQWCTGNKKSVAVGWRLVQHEFWMHINHRQMFIQFVQSLVGHPCLCSWNAYEKLINSTEVIETITTWLP